MTKRPCDKELERSGFSCYYSYKSRSKRCRECIFRVPENWMERIGRKWHKFCRVWFK